MKLPKYPELNRISLLYPGPQILLGKTIYWTEKRDGSQLRVALVDGEPCLATHHQSASSKFQQYFKETGESDSVMELLRDTNGLSGNPVADFNIQAVVFGELLCKGKSPARFETHDKYEFVLFDIWSGKEGKFIPYPLVYSYAYRYGLPVVDCWAQSEHLTLENLYETRDNQFLIAKAKGREGVVLKNYSEQIFAKEKLDNPVIPRIKEEGGQVQLPVLPDSEVFGAISKAEAELGENFLDKRLAMPLIAKYVAEEENKHLCSKPRKNLFSFYQAYLEGKNETTSN